MAEVENLGGVGGDDEVVELGAGEGGAVDPGEQGFAGDLAEDLAGKACGGEAGRDDAEDAWRWCHRDVAAVVLVLAVDVDGDEEDGEKKKAQNPGCAVEEAQDGLKVAIEGVAGDAAVGGRGVGDAGSAEEQ